MNDTPRLYFRTPRLAELAAPFVAQRIVSAGSLAIVDTAARRFGEQDPEVLLGLALAVEAQARGHVGLDLRLARDLLTPLEPSRAAVDDDDASPDDSAPEAAPPTPPPWPASVTAWEAAVCASPMVGELDDAKRPFARQALRGGETLVMSRRMAWEQQRLAEGLKRLATTAPEPSVPEALMASAIPRLLPHEAGENTEEGEAVELSRAALRRAATRSLSVVTGGPGTGKTFSIKRLLALLIEAAKSEAPDRPLQVALAAPTGKAAVRMTEAMAEDLAGVDTAGEVRAQLESLPASTVHRLLRIRPDGTTRYGADQPLPLDVVVVDEASMLDLVLMRKLTEAIGPGARLVLLGDRDQLASVDAGTVLSDIVSGHFEDKRGPLEGAVSAFRHSRRFKDAPTVAAVARAIQDRAPERAVAWMMPDGPKVPGETVPDRVKKLEPEPKQGRPSKELLDELVKPYLAPGGYAGRIAQRLRDGGFASLQHDQRALLEALDGYRILAAHRAGPLGVSGLVREIGKRVREALTMAYRERKRSARSGATAEQKPRPQGDKEPLPTRSGHWLGEPILVTQNAYDVDLRNGDVGLVLPGADGKLTAVFPVMEGAVKAVRAVALSRLPPHMGALAMTIHKSQGSQFKHVAVVLSGRPDRPSPIQTRELVYTGVTRASQRLTWVGTDAELEASLARPIARTSGLGTLLWEG
ncbi:MAG: hypothetical protein EP329_08870 [Deltaproteobacteria bacterium]|nr:MAG: hypothetical protein EP329_08870 [Deltaproteobacteria bacterium]